MARLVRKYRDVDPDFVEQINLYLKSKPAKRSAVLRKTNTSRDEALLPNLTTNTLEIVLSFGVSALLFLVTEELLIEAHEEAETIWHTSAFFVGFLIFLILGMVI